MRKIGRIFIGWVFVTVGVIGVIFPIMPGWVFLISGVVMLAKDVPFFAGWICRVENRFPRVRKFILRIHGKVNIQSPKPPCPP